jgi:hypothetical protein
MSEEMELLRKLWRAWAIDRQDGDNVFAGELGSEIQRMVERTEDVTVRSSKAAIDKIAETIRNVTDEFDQPVGLYISGEACRRWMAANPDGDPVDFYASHDELEDYRIIAKAVAAILP